jgi:hypothetical protein
MWQETTITYSELISQICYRMKIKTMKCQSQQPVLVQHSKWYFTTDSETSYRYVSAIGHAAISWLNEDVLLFIVKVRLAKEYNVMVIITF